MAKRTNERAWTSLDDVDYEEDADGANPMPDDDGNVVLKRKESNGRRRNNGKSQAARKAAPRRAGTNARKATGEGK